MVSKTVMKLSIALAISATIVVVTVANWFAYTNIHNQARADVHQDIQMVSKEAK
ncbi:hypothetical protein [Arthrobacter sp. KNU40]|uniref:hypothetical protein n=1 Tax=Arthrobacter sp. KNU40 TaxID=3447965 RepID=UPI003F62C633